MPLSYLHMATPSPIEGGGGGMKQDLLSLAHHHFKLCGFMRIVVSVDRFEASALGQNRDVNNHLSSSEEGEREEEEEKKEGEEGKAEKKEKEEKKEEKKEMKKEEEDLTMALIGSPCWLDKSATRVVLHTRTAFVLRPLPPSNCLEETPLPPSVSDSPFPSSNNDDGEHRSIAFPSEVTPLSLGRRKMNTRNSVKTSTGKKRKRCSSSSHRDILQHLHDLTHRNRVKVQGHIMSISQRVHDGKEEVRALVLLELYLPSSLWSDPSSWKPGPSAAAALSHLSCDWDSWREYIAMICGPKDLCLASSEDLWSPSECRVVGCKLHAEVIETVRRARFDLHSLFKTLRPFGRNEHGCRVVITPTDTHCKLGLWDIPDEVLVGIFSRLGPKDLQSVAAVCRRTRELSVPIMPCLNLKLFPHQQGAVQWMLHRELNPQVLRHPFFKDFQTEDGFLLYLNCVTGDLSSEIPPAMMDFRGGLFCDEPGLGKTVTALSLILKTQGTLSQPPHSVPVHWCDHSSGDRYGYYETLSPSGKNMLKRCMDLKARRNNVGSSPSSLDSFGSLTAFSLTVPSTSFSRAQKKPRTVPQLEPLSSVKRSLLEAYEEELTTDQECQPPLKARNSRLRSSSSSSVVENKARPTQDEHSTPRKSNKKAAIATTSCLNEEADVWVQCDSCSKWRRVLDRRNPPKEGLAWFCNMNKDPLHQKCLDPEENWDGNGKIKSFPGFYRQGSPPGNKHNILHFASVLQEFAMLRNADTNRALKWLVSLSSEKLSKMAGSGLGIPSGMYLPSSFGDEHHGYTKIFQRFGLIQRREGKGAKKWCYPTGLDEDLTLDLLALKEALANRMDVTRLYLSRATLIVVPANLVDHWKNQILKHTKPGQLRVFVWSEQRKPPNVQDLAWNFDIIITTFSRLSSEWSSKESSVLLSIHWLRIILDEGHTLGSSLCLTNKLQMAVSMHASRRWILTGTPTPNTPNSQLSHLQPMLKFLHEGYYGQSQKVWESGILKPFEAWEEEGRVRLTELLERSMISARKSDLCNIPPCLRKVTLLDFTQKHAESYNELVVTVRRNILLADWNDPEHVESLLNPKQWKFRSNTIRNVRLSCCVAGHIKVRNAGEDIQETMDILVQEGMDSLSLEFGLIKAALLYGGNCNRCQEWCRLPILTPCRHFLCMDCVALDKEKCTLSGCGNPYKMQSPEDRARPENPNPKWPVPQDLIELQPSYVQDNWDPDWEATSSSKVAYLVERLKQLKGSFVGASFDNESATSLPNEEYRATGFCPSDSDRDCRTEKAIVFSQFLEHIFVIERQLTQAGIRVAGLYSPMHSSTKMKSLSLFRYDKDCTVLLMDGSAALGLDLSFVTHVFLMEPIWDRSMEEQVVSRAHRMGATRPVLVETLAMRGTIEEQMLEFLQDPIEYNRVMKLPTQDSSGNSRNQRTVHEFAESSYLARLSFVRTKTSASTQAEI